MNLQKELQKIAAKYTIESQEKFKAEITDIVVRAVADLVEIGRAKKGMDETIARVAIAFNVIPQSLFVRSRRERYLAPRQMAQYLLFAQGYGYSDIAKVWGQDHTTVMNSTRKMHQQIKNGYYLNQYQEVINEIKELFMEGVGIDDGTPAPEDCPL
jgi:chromosomal replication initiation ATPase DnaA